jgi:hypothetical protein
MRSAELVLGRVPAPGFRDAPCVLGVGGGDFETELGVHCSLLSLVFTD